jgi:ribosomal protein L37AE/L43A
MIEEDKIMFKEPKRSARAIPKEDRMDLSYCPWCRKTTHTSAIKFKHWICGKCGREKSIEYYEKHKDDKI